MRGPAETGNEHGSCPGPGVFLVTREGFSVTSFGLRDQPGQPDVLGFPLVQGIVQIAHEHILCNYADTLYSGL